MKMHEPALTLIKLRQGDEGLVHCDEAYVLAGASASETSVASPPLTSYHFR
jgi:hypothetical protein